MNSSALNFLIEEFTDNSNGSISDIYKISSKFRVTL